MILTVFFIGAALLAASIAIRRMSRVSHTSAAAYALLVAATAWNAVIVFAFLSPHNRHVLHLATHRTSVLANGAIGIVWFSLCVVSAVKWFRSNSRPQNRVPAEMHGVE